MKQTKLKNHSAKNSIKAHPKTKRRVKDNRPLHRTIAFHPINLLFLLCAGVLLCASTLSAMAASYSVTGTVPAPIPTSAAVITSPNDNQQLSPQTQTISGTCPTNTYIQVSDNGTLSAIAICDQTGAFQASISLSSGADILSAQDYNVTNNPGPSSPPITIYYYPPIPPSNPGGSGSPPSNGSNTTTTTTVSGSQSTYVAPVAVQILQVDTDTPYRASGPPQIVSYSPTFTGIAPPNSLIVVTIHTNPYYCHTYSNAQGYWTCTFNQIIPPGQHTVDVTVQTPSGKTITLNSFHILVVAAAPKSQTQSGKFVISTNYAYKVWLLNQPVSLHMHISGGAAPFAFTVTWGDGAISTYVKQDSTNFTISHTYTHLNASIGSMPVKIAAVDTKGDFSSLQLDTAIRNPNFVASTSGFNGTSFLNDVKPWLTVLWPGYVVIVLMVFSFWLGERQETVALIRGKKLSKRPQHRHSH